METEHVVAAVRAWVRDFVIAEGLCPFARTPFQADRIRFAVTGAADEAALLDRLTAELTLLESSPEVETTLLIHPRVLGDFEDYNQFLDDAEYLLVRSGLDGVFQIASFHPQYRFAGTDPGDAENYSNRTPFPLLHLLRESSVTAAIDGYPRIEDVPGRNVAHLEALGAAELERRLRALANG